MKGLYIARVNKDDYSNIGVINKCLSQVKSFEACGATMDMLWLNKNGVVLNNQMVYTSPFSIYRSSLSKSIFFLFVLYRLIKRLVNFNDYRFIYIRYELSHPMFTQWLSYAKKKNPDIKIIIEIPTYPYEKEAGGLFGKVQYWLDKKYRKKLKNYVSFICHYGKLSEIFGIPTICIQNGINVDNRIISKSIPAVNCLRLIAIGNWNVWHGLDRLIIGLANFYNLTDSNDCKVTLNVVGEGRALAKIKKIVHEKQIEDYVMFHGILKGTLLDQLCDRADIGIGNLGFFRTGLQLAFPLKHREYCARGLPFILSTTDLDFPKSTPWVHYIPENEDSVSINALIGFFYETKKIENIKKTIREYAERNLTWKKKMSQLLSEINDSSTLE